MGCSPSKGKLFSRQKAGEEMDCNNLDPGEKNECLKTDNCEEESPLPKEQPVDELVDEHLAMDAAVVQSPENIEELEVNVPPQEIDVEDNIEDKIKKAEKRKKNKSFDKRRRTEKQSKASIIQAKVELPPHMVKAHQAAYAYLNPNISKYDTLLVLLDQAAQTHLSLQPMMTALVLRFEEINQALEEMAENGEMMLREHGDYMAWPSGMITRPSVKYVKPSADGTHPPDPPPDLLQQLLQHSTEKMRLVGTSFQGLGDTTLEEAVEYFASISKLLSDRLHGKRAAEQRLAQVLGRVEEATIQKSNPEDSALHSEDSGIGGENESLTGSERHRRHRGSASSGSCGSGGNVRAALDTPNNFLNHVGLNEGEEEEEEEEEVDEEGEEEEDEEDECERPGRKRSNSSPPDPSQPLPRRVLEYIKEQQHRRPLTATTSRKPECPSGVVDPLLELQKSQRDVDQQLRNMGESREDGELVGSHHNMSQAGLRRHSLSGSGISRSEVKGPMRTNQPPGSLPAIAPHPPGRNSVRRLINSFSQGVDGRPGQSLANIPPHIKRPRRSGTLTLPDIGTGDKALVVNGNNNNNSWPDSRDDLDVDSLPPPPPEVLMDNSFQSTNENPGDAETGSDRGRQVTHQRTGVSQRLRASMQNVSVLPNRASVRQKSLSVTPAGPAREDAEQQPDNDLDLEKENATTLYQQARKIIHLCNAAESPVKTHQLHQWKRGLSPLHTGAGPATDSSGIYEPELSPGSLLVTAPPVSRVRLPPSLPSVHHRFPSPPVFRPQPSSGASRTPSRPSSPRTLSWARENVAEEIIPSVSFNNARSVFCQYEQHSSQTWTPSSSSVQPRLWGEDSRGRQAARGMETSSRRTQSEQRPRANAHSEAPQERRRTSFLVKKTEPAAMSTTERPGSAQVRQMDGQPDPSAGDSAAGTQSRRH